MQCISCQEEVSEKLLHAIANNACPFCGQLIMEAELQTLLNSLAAVMCELETKDFLPQAEAWLRQNFDLISLHSDEYIALDAERAVAKDKLAVADQELLLAKKEIGILQKMPARNTKPMLDADGNPIQVDGEIVQVAAPEKTSEFFKRADAGKLAGKTNELAKLAAKIRAKGGNSLTMPMEDVVEDADYDQYDQGESWEEPLDPIAESLVAMGGGGGSQSGYVAKDVQKLQQLQAKQRNASRAMAGGGAGMFSRSS